MRLFLSINWSRSLIIEFENLQGKLQHIGIRGHWRRGENLHLTLKFLGEIPPSQIDDISVRLEHLGKTYQAFEVDIVGFGVFPNIKSPRILWLGVKSNTLLEVQSEIEESLHSLGISREPREYQPHITLASGEISGLTSDKLKIGEQISFREFVSSICLMESSVIEGRRVYREIKKYDLRT